MENVLTCPYPIRGREECSVTGVGPMRCTLIRLMLYGTATLALGSGLVDERRAMTDGRCPPLASELLVMLCRLFGVSG